ncbi:hypothetical protein B296_00015339 [Ensete ventricosum]|uniref:Uncharacterized protein n=1 Tax=Ensete ventricosum TaxID=4639 RepID=A0A426YYY6_ENSVE|nr:hypothetical protein B296_00015339 [Ensete ventricosum]
MEDELLNMTRNMEGLKVKLPQKAVVDYKESLGFQMGLVRTRQVSYELEPQSDSQFYKAQRNRKTTSLRLEFPSDRARGGYSSTWPRWCIFLHSERDDVLLRSANDPSLILISPLEGLNFFVVLGRRSEVIIKEVFEHHCPILGKVVEVT